MTKKKEPIAEQAVKETKVENVESVVAEQTEQVVETSTETKENNKSKIRANLAPKTQKVDKSGKPEGVNIPDHIFDVVCYVKYNAALRRHCALNLIDTLTNDGVLKQGTKPFVEFLWNKIRISQFGLNKEYSYYEDFFIQALGKAVVDVANDVQRDLNKMITVYNENLASEINSTKTTD